jgi:hypothetical protein
MTQIIHDYKNIVELMQLQGITIQFLGKLRMNNTYLGNNREFLENLFNTIQILLGSTNRQTI